MRLAGILCALFISISAQSQTIDVPHTFSAGTRASASEVNENFQRLVSESNSQDARIEALRSSQSVSDQLICYVAGSGFANPNFNQQARCRQASDLNNIINMTLDEILLNGWIAVSASEQNWIFNMY